jgi:short-subunit dehydrogenase
VTAASKWALITGASAGIGLELAKVFAANGWNLVLVARNEARLNELRQELKSSCQIESQVIAQDLSSPGAASRIFNAAKEKDVSALVNNAGVGAYGPFAEAPLETQINMMQVNMRALVELTHLFLQPMIAKRHGRIMNVASTAAFQPGPTVNIYYATKAFVFSFSYALSVELEATGVSVTALCPGMTRTEFFERARLPGKPGLAMDPAKVARIGYDGMIKGKRTVIPGALNKIMSFLARRTPPALTSRIVRRIHADK